MDIIAGRRKAGRVHGDVFVANKLVVRGSSVTTSTGTLRSAYVMQDCDVFEGLLTARETVSYVLQLRSPDIALCGYAPSHVASALSVLGLSHVADTLVKHVSNITISVQTYDSVFSLSQLSGGEKRRLSIAVEMVTNPAVLLVDEVTTGLDAQSALRVVSCIKNLGCTAICTVHQPRSTIYHLFDCLPFYNVRISVISSILPSSLCIFPVVMLLQRGMCMYFGPSMHSVPYFARFGIICPLYMNPAGYGN